MNQTTVDRALRALAEINGTSCAPVEKIPPMPPGVELLTWNPKRPPVAITQCAVVTDVESFVAATLQQLGRLLLRRQPDSRQLRDLVDALEQCGVVVRIRGVGSPGRR